MKSPVVSVLNLFENKKRYIVPLFQRQYVWNVERQWTPLWEDIERKAVEKLRWDQRRAASVGDELKQLEERPPSEHFLGAIVLDQHRTFGMEVPANIIIDGQQRLTTCQVFLAAFRDVVQEQGLLEFSDELRSYTLNTGVMVNEEAERYKVWPTEFDQPHFRAIIDSGSFAGLSEQYPILEKRRLTGTPRLVQAYVFFFRAIDAFLKRELVSEYLQSQPIVVERVKALFGTFKDNLQIVSIELEGQDDPQVIFETLNARGERLLPSDLLRNYLFWRASKEGAEVRKLYQSYWQPFDTDFWKLEEKQGRLKRPRVDLFFFNLLQAKTGREVNVARLYYEYKGWSESIASTSIDHELSEIHRYSVELEKLLRPSSDTAIGRFAQMLKIFDVKTIFPLAMKLLADGHLSEKHLASILVDFESYLVRRQVCGLTSQNYNQVFVNWISRLSENGPEISQTKLHNIMRAEQSQTNLWPDDARFLQAWLNDPLYPRLKSNTRMEYILRRLEMYTRTAKHEDVSIKSGLTIEHVLPQQWYEFWPLKDGNQGRTPEERLQYPSAESEQRDRSLHTIGNLTLLTGPLNTAVRNHPFDVKVSQIEGYSLLALNGYFTSRFAEGKGWEEDAIAERGRALFDMAKVIWPHPES